LIIKVKNKSENSIIQHTNIKVLKKLYLPVSSFLILKIKHINIYNHNIRYLFKIVLLVVLVCDICTKILQMY